MEDNRINTPVNSNEFEVENILEEIIAQHLKESPFDTIEEEKRELITLDRAVSKAASKYEQVLQKLVERYGVKNSKIEKIGKGLFRIPLRNSYLETLPDGYGYIGGAARSELLRELELDTESTPRDKDIVRIVSEDVLGIDDRLGQEFSAEDYTHGHGVQELRENYFKTRDFTINELLVYKNFIYLTKSCLLDTIRGILRFTKYELINKEQKENEEEENRVRNDKVLAKAIRLASEALVRGRKLEIENKETFRIQTIQLFHIALHLDRAFERGVKIADEYVRQLVAIGQLPEDIKDSSQALDYLIHTMDESFAFQYAKLSTLETDEQISQEETLDKSFA